MNEPIKEAGLAPTDPHGADQHTDAIPADPVAPAELGPAAGVIWPSPEFVAVIEVLDAPEQRRFTPEAALGHLGGTLMRLDGRTARSEYWWGTAFLASVWTALSLAFVALLGSASLVIAVAAGLGLIVLLPFVIVLEGARAVRRLHDADLNGAWTALALVPGGLIALIWLLTKPGTEGENRFGAMSQPGWDRTEVLSA